MKSKKLLKLVDDLLKTGKRISFYSSIDFGRCFLFSEGDTWISEAFHATSDKSDTLGGGSTNIVDNKFGWITDRKHDLMKAIQGSGVV